MYTYSLNKIHCLAGRIIITELDINLAKKRDTSRDLGRGPLTGRHTISLWFTYLHTIILPRILIYIISTLLPSYYTNV